MAGMIHYVRPLDPDVEAAFRARGDVFFAECRAAHDALVARNVAAVLASERIPLLRAA